MDVRAHCFVSGRVQGVFFRSYALDKARELGLTGWVKNLMDGRVEAVFEGEEGKVKEAVDWLWQGSPYSKVEDVGVLWEEYKGEFRVFETRYY
ncbi:MAG: acylphosphatase [Candidatus Hydrothermarchaeales archaeon]